MYGKHLSLTLDVSTFQFPIPLPDVTFSPFGEAAGSAGDGGHCIGVPFLFLALLFLIHHWLFDGP